MKKIWLLTCCIISILLLIIIIDIIRVAWCSEPYFSISSNCEYTEEWSIYTSRGIWYKYVENSLDTILWIETYIFWIKSCDIPLWWDVRCKKEEKVEENENTPVEERTKTLDENPWVWANKEGVYPIERLKTLDTWLWVHPYWKFSSKNRDNLMFFESESEEWTISRFAIYDRENHKWLFDCFDWWGGLYIQVDETVDIDSVDVMSCKEKYEEAMNYLENWNEKSDSNIDYKFYAIEKEDSYDIKINEENLTDLQKEIFKKYNNWIKTNDESWNIELLDISEVEKDKDSYNRWFYDPSFDADWRAKYMNPWEDKYNLYISLWDENYAVSKQEFPWYVPLNTMWVQAFDWFVGYSDWYLILFPYKFPVEKWSFVSSKQDRRYRVLNWWVQYHHYIGRDKDYIYLWEDDGYIIIKRIPKESDFKILEKNEEWKWLYDKDTWFEDVTSEFVWNSIFENEESLVNNYPPVYKNWNYLLVSDGIWWEYYNWIWRFPVDMDTLQVEKFKDPNPVYDYLDNYYVISDKDYYYQIIDSGNWYKTFKRIKK